MCLPLILPLCNVNGTNNFSLHLNNVMLWLEIEVVL